MKNKNYVDTDETLHLREQVARLVEDGKGFYSSCKKKLLEDSGQNRDDQQQKDFSEFSSLLLKYSQTKPTGNDPDEPECTKSLRKNLHTMVRHFGTYPQVQRRGNMLKERLGELSEYADIAHDGLNFTLLPQELDYIDQRCSNNLEKKHLLFNLFITRGMSPQVSKLIIEQMYKNN